jgi:hypothetical protein
MPALHSKADVPCGKTEMSAIGTKPSFEVDIFICDLGVAKIEGLRQICLQLNSEGEFNYTSKHG